MTSLAFAAVAFSPFVLSAAQVKTQSKSSYNSSVYTYSNGYSPFVDKTFWVGGVDPMGSTAISYDFVIAHASRTPDTSDWSTYAYAKNGLNYAKGFWNGVFKGHSLAVQAKVQWKNRTEKAKMTIGYLRLIEGAIMELANPGSFYVEGAATLYGPRTNPTQVIHADPTDATPREFVLRSNLTGAFDTGMAVFYTADLADARAKLTLEGDNAAYQGNFKAGKQGILSIKTAASAGATQAAFDPQAIVLEQGGVFTCPTANAVFPASQNRGVTVEATGGCIEAPVDWTLAYPIAGEGVLTKTGTATLTLDGPFAAAGLAVKEGAVAFGPSFEAGAEARLSYVGGLTVAYGETPAVCPMPLAFGEPIPVAITGVPTIALGEELKIAVFKMPLAVQKLRVGDFRFVAGYASAKLSIETVEGVQTVYAHVNRGVKARDTTSYFTVPDSWEESKGPAENAALHYLFDAKNGRIDASLNYGLYAFPAASLACNSSYFTSKAYIFDCADLRLWPKTTFRFSGSSGTVRPADHPASTQDLTGRVYIHANEANPVMFAPVNNHLCRIKATISGQGKIRLKGISDSEAAAYEISADNSDYTGLLEVRGYTAANETQKNTVLTLKIADETNLGSNPHVYHADALWLGTNQVLQATASLTIDDANRGIRLDSGAVIDTPEAVTLTTRTSPTFQGGEPVVKRGAGTWAMGKGAARPVAVGSGASLRVAEGSLAPLAADVLEKLPVTFAAGKTLVVDPAEGAVRVGSCTAEGEVKLALASSFAVDEESFSVAFLSFADEASAKAFAAKARLVKVPQHSGILAVRPAAEAGRYEVEATYGAPSGCMILLR